MALTVDVEQLGRDLWLPETGDESVKVTATGDIASVEGHENLRSALRRRLVTSPGELTHRPQYGAGVVDHLERANSPSRRAQLANAIRRNVLRDARVKDCSAGVSAGAGGTTSREAAVTVDLTVKVTHTSATESFSTEFSE